MTTGRPPAFTPSIANEICDRLGKGESLRSITGADRDDFMPCESTVRSWLQRGEAGEEPYEEFLRQYTRAREVQADTFFDQVIDISDEDAKEAVDVARNRLRVDARKWAASKLAPKKYGEKLDLNHSGEITMPPELRQAEIERLLAQRANAPSAGG